MNELNNRMVGLSDDLVDADGACKTLIQDIARIDIEISENADVIRNLERDEGQQQQQLSQESNEAKAASDNLKKAEDELQKVEHEIRQAKAEISRLRGRHCNDANQIRARDDSVAKLQRDVSNYSLQKGKLRRDIAEFQRLRDEKGHNSGEVRNRHNALSAEVARKHQQKRDLAARKAQVAIQLDEAKVAAGKKERCDEEARTKAEALIEGIKSDSDALSALQIDLSGKRNAYNATKGEQKVLDYSCNEAKKQIKEDKQTLRTMKIALEDNKIKSTKLNESISKIQSKIGELTSHRHNLEGKKEQGIDDVKQKTERISAAEKTYIGANEEYSAVNEELQQLNDSKTEVLKNIESRKKLRTEAQSKLRIADDRYNNALRTRRMEESKRAPSPIKNSHEAQTRRK